MTRAMTEDLVHRVQRGLLTLTEDLERLDRQLAALVDSLDGEAGPLPLEVASTADAVRRDLLCDATRTLRMLGHATDASARARQVAVDGAAERLAAGCC